MSREIWLRRQDAATADRVHEDNPFPSEVHGANPTDRRHLGFVGGRTRLLTATVFMSAPGAYASGDYIGLTAQTIALPRAVRSEALSGVLQSIVIVDQAAQSANLDVHFFTAPVTTPTDNAAWAISDADALKTAGFVSVTTHSASSNNNISVANNCGLGLVLPTTTLYCAVVARSTPTFATGDLLLTFVILQD